jgi:hypothetical protein
MDSHRWIVCLHHIRLNERNLIAWGLGYRFTHDVVEQAQNLAFLPPTLDRNLYSGFVQDEVALAKKSTPALGGNSGFRSETLRAYELGYRPRLGSTASASLSTFYNDYDQVRSLTFTPGTIVPLYFANDLAGNTYIELDGALRWVDKLIANNNGLPATVPSYSELDVHLGWHPIPKLELAVVGQNLLHDHHPEHGIPIGIPDREEIQRSVYGRISYGW